MKLTALVECLGDGQYRAKIWELVVLESEGASEDEAIERLRQKLITRLQGCKVVEIDLADSSSRKPWRTLADFSKTPVVATISRT